MATEVKEENNAAPSHIKNDGDIDDEVDSAVDNSIKDDKDSVKNETKEESGKEGSNDEEDEEEGELALLDRPVEVTGCRARKKVERLTMSLSAPKKKQQEIQEGKGKKLGDCPRIDAQIQKRKVADLKILHKILFNRPGSNPEIKKNIRKFSGFSFEKDSLDFTRKKTSVEKLVTSVLKQICETLDLERGKTKEDIVNRIMDFLLNPVDSGKSVEVKSKKRSSKDKKKSANKKTKTENKAKTEKKEGSEENESEDGEDDENSTGGEASMGGTDEENEDASLSDEPKKKSKDTKAPKTKPKAEKGKKEEKKTKATKRKASKDSAGSSGEEQHAKKTKMPSDEDITKLVKEILDAADLQEITMKKVIKQVSDAFPDFDLTHKKAFIKSTIKSVIS